MDGVGARAAWDLVDAIKGLGGRDEQSEGFATFVRTDPDGTPWVRLAGAAGDTPVNGQMLSDAEPCQTVRYRIDGGRLSVTGNASAPATSAGHVDAVVAPVAAGVEVARLEAVAAQESAETASIAAQQAVNDAAAASAAATAAQGSANQAQISANAAQASATSANNSANAALMQLSIVEDVSGTLSWIRDHGTYRATTDTTVQDGTIYFELVGGDYVPISSPDPSANPSTSGWYVLDVTDSQTDYIMAHLAVTSAGLWVLPSGIGQAADAQHAAGYKALLAANGMTIYDGGGTAVVTYGQSTTFATDRDWMVGNQNAFVFYDASENTLQIGGANVTIGGKAPADLLTSLDVSATQTATGADITINGTTVSLTNGAQGDAGGRWYAGTGITGTSTTATIFSGSGVSSAVVGDMYLNTSTYNTYRCTVAGAPSVAKWVYTTANIKGAQGETGPQGETGGTGAQGVSITGVEHQYYLSTSSSTQTGGSWAVAPATYVEGRYYWERWKITFSDSSVDYTDATLAEEVKSVWTAIESSNEQIALKANSADVYTKTATDGLISTEVTNRNAAIQVSADAINQTVSTKVGKSEVISSINQTSESVTIDASKINLVGAVTISDLASATQDAVLNSNVDVPDQMVWYGACSTSAGTTAKSVTCTGFELLTGARIAVKFSTANTAASPTLNVNSKGAKAVWYNNEAASATNPVRWGANATLNFVYDGTYWVLDEKPPSYAAPCSTTASTRAKVATVAGALVVNGTTIALQCSTANTYASNSITFNLSSTGALTVYRDNAATSTTNKLLWDANTVLTLVMQGGYWHLADNGTRTMSEDAAADAADAAKTATNYITYVNATDGIKIAESSASASSTFMQLTSSFLDFVRGGTSMIKAWVDNTVAKVRIGAETSFNTLIDGEGIKLREGTAMSAQFTEDLIELGGEDAEISLCGGKGLIKYDSSLALPFQVLGAENVVISTNSQTSKAYVGVLDDSVTIYSGDVSLMSDTITVWATSLGTSHEYDMADFVDSIPVTLYDNASASASTSATLSETAANFKRLTIFFKDVDNNYSSVDVWSPNEKRVALSLTWINGASTQEMYQRVRWVTISGTSISTYKASSDSKYRTGQVKLGATASVTNSDYISITHVIGYR